MMLHLISFLFISQTLFVLPSSSPPTYLNVTPMLEYLWWLAEGCVLSGQSQVNWQVEFILRFLKEYHCTSLLCAVLATELDMDNGNNRKIN